MFNLYHHRHFQFHAHFQFAHCSVCVFLCDAMNVWRKLECNASLLKLFSVKMSFFIISSVEYFLKWNFGVLVHYAIEPVDELIEVVAWPGRYAAVHLEDLDRLATLKNKPA